MYKISVIVPVYNAEQYISKTINQILCGNTKMIENIEIKNKYLALTDNKENLLAVIEKKDKNIYSFIDI